MENDLLTHYETLRKQLPLELKNSEFNFTPESFPKPIASLQSQDLVLIKTKHYWDSYCQADLILFQGTESVFQSLGLMILDAVLNSLKIELKLENPQSLVKSLNVKYNFLETPHEVFGYHAKPNNFIYYPDAVSRHPWTSEKLSSWDFPGFFLSNLEMDLGTDVTQWEARDALFIEGKDHSLIRLAKLLLDIGNSKQVSKEYDLENNIGFEGVSPGSVEVKFVLPGSDCWQGK